MVIDCTPNSMGPSGELPLSFVKLGVPNEILVAAGGEQVVTRADNGVADAGIRKVDKRTSV
jgi:hypothetical protein